MNIIDYIKKHQNEDFKTFKFNEIDNLILSLVPYVNFKDIVPPFKGSKITLEEAVKKLEEKPSKGFIGNTYKMLKLMKDTKRYKDALLYNYLNIINDEMQFGAITIKLNDNSIYIAFAGTDTSIIGWEEDFKMAYLYPGVSQKYAGVYLKKAIGIWPRTIRLGGHSKGGNLAISATMMQNRFNQKRIKCIYNNDGPGFLKAQVESKEYKNISSKIKMFVPKESIIGMILYHEKNYTVVKAKSFGIFQHDAFNWQCENDHFIKSNLTKRSKKIETELTHKLEEMPLDKRIKLSSDLFNIFHHNNIKDTKDIKIQNFFKLIKEFKHLDKNTQNLLIEFLIMALI